MADTPQGRRRGEREDQAYRLARWFGPVYTIYKIAKDTLKEFPDW